MTITKQQWEAVGEDICTLSAEIRELQAELNKTSSNIDDLCIAIGNMMAIIDNLRYRRIPDLERRTEHGTNHNNH